MDSDMYQISANATVENKSEFLIHVLNHMFIKCDILLCLQSGMTTMSNTIVLFFNLKI